NLNRIINDSKSQHFITWIELGTSFIVANVGKFSRSILSLHFKHNNVCNPYNLIHLLTLLQFSSFVHQLNNYGFHKIQSPSHLAYLTFDLTFDQQISCVQCTSTTSETWEFNHLNSSAPTQISWTLSNIKHLNQIIVNIIKLPSKIACLLNDM
ncbi:hypothetical protein BDR06DRAFT_1053519, partial [Suillus hirtellus]